MVAAHPLSFPRSPSVRWLVQVPRIYRVLRMRGTVKSFAEQLENVFKPLFEVTLDPASDPPLARGWWTVFTRKCRDAAERPIGQRPLPTRSRAGVLARVCDANLLHWRYTNHPVRLAGVALQMFVGFDSVDDESGMETDFSSLVDVSPDQWTGPDEPPYNYWL